MGLRTPSRHFIFFCMIQWTLTFVVSKADGLECDYYNITECQQGSKNCQQSKQTVACGEDGPSLTYGCFVLWQRVNESNQDSVQYKGCFLNDKQCVENEECVEKGFRRFTTNTYTLFCCCSKDNCNRNHAWKPDPTTTTVKPYAIGIETVYHKSTASILVFTLVPLMCAVVIIGAIYIRQRILKKPLPSLQSGLTDEENILLEKSESPYCKLTMSVTLVEKKASGRFGSVWKATMAGSNSFVAVKNLPFREKVSWKLEQEVYSLPLMGDSEFILRFLGARSCSEGENHQLWLVSEYLEHGSLYDYLKGNALKWSELLKVAITMSQGLAFLHEEMDSGLRGYKPAVAHRDFKSKNVLLRPDLTACIADFGLAHIFYPMKPMGTSHGQVGTRRYMAPEVLEGAVSFTRDNFQRIDMYACGLVLWELASRCSSQQGPVGDYRLPFEEFVGQQPSLEEMQDIVVTQRRRPTIQKDWLSHPGMLVLSEAMKDSWDPDAEARISASCIVERLSSISNRISSV